MDKKWAIKLGTPILALVLMSACGTANNNNDDIPDTNTPENEAPNNNDDTNVPDNDVNDNRDQDPSNNNNNDDMSEPNNTENDNRAPNQE